MSRYRRHFLSDLEQTKNIINDSIIAIAQCFGDKENLEPNWPYEALKLTRINKEKLAEHYQGFMMTQLLSQTSYDRRMQQLETIENELLIMLFTHHNK